MATEPGPLLASGRDGDIFEFGPGLVLRRAKSGRVIEGEARTIAYAGEHGYPVPKIHEVRAGGTEIVMERIDGPMMMDKLLREPWRMPRYCRELADLHDRLHVIPAPPWLPDAGGDRLVHLDLHPMNVIMTAAGPVVIDWTNAALAIRCSTSPSRCCCSRAHAYRVRICSTSRSGPFGSSSDAPSRGGTAGASSIVSW